MIFWVGLREGRPFVTSRKTYPAFFHAASASSTRRAAFAIATSIILPSTVVVALPCASRLVERLQHAGVVVELGRARAVEPVARLDLRGMNELAPAIAEPTRERGIALEAFGVADIGEHAVERGVEPRRARRQKRVRAGVHHFRPVARPSAAEVGVEIAILRAAEGERSDAPRPRSPWS